MLKLQWSLLKRWRSSELQGYSSVKVKLKEMNFPSTINVFVIYVLRGWYFFDWKAFVLVMITNIWLSEISES